MLGHLRFGSCYVLNMAIKPDRVECRRRYVHVQHSIQCDKICVLLKTSLVHKTAYSLLDTELRISFIMTKNELRVSDNSMQYRPRIKIILHSKILPTNHTVPRLLAGGQGNRFTVPLREPYSALELSGIVSSGLTPPPLSPFLTPHKILNPSMICGQLRVTLVVPAWQSKSPMSYIYDPESSELGERRPTRKHFLWGVRDVDAASSDIKKLEAFHLRCQTRYANKQNWRHLQNSYPEGVHHYLVISLDLTQVSQHIKPCGCRRTFPQDGIRVPVAWKRLPGGPRNRWIFQIPDDRRALTGMPPSVVDMEEGRSPSLKTMRWWWWWR